jgi:hypothetical protein
MGEAADHPLLLDVDHHCIAGLAPGDERDDTVVAGLGPLHHAGVTVDEHAGTIARGCDSYVSPVFAGLRASWIGRQAGQAPA